MDPDKLKAYSFLLFSKLEGAMTSGMVHLGDRLGLYRALSSSREPATSAQLAEVTGLHERWVREWARNQAAAKLIAWEEHGDHERYWLTDEAAAVLADPDHPAYGMGMFFRLPQSMSHLERLPESFRTGLGYDYDAHGEEGAIGVERSFEPWYRNFLVPNALPAVAMVETLRAGAVAADVGCGAGVAVLTMARAFPESQFHGYDISEHALARAEAKRFSQGLVNAHFHDVRTEPLPDDHSLALVTTFDCLHDMTHPDRVMKAIRRAIRPDGVWLVADIKARDTFAENVQKNPMASMMYATSVLSCMSSALSEEDGLGLGTLGLPPSLLETMTRDAGFTQFRRLDLESPVNAFYEIRP